MSKNIEITNELNKVMADALQHLQKLVTNDIDQQHDFLLIVRVFLLGVISTAVDLVEVTSPGAAPLLYADIEAIAKIGGLRSIKNTIVKGSLNYSVSNIAPNDIETAINYLGMELSMALYKGFHELPLSLRSSEILLRGIEALVSNLLNQKFDNPHQVLDSFCEHVHMALDGLASHGNSQALH